MEVEIAPGISEPVLQIIHIKIIVIGVIIVSFGVCIILLPFY